MLLASKRTCFENVSPTVIAACLSLGFAPRHGMTTEESAVVPPAISSTYRDLINPGTGGQFYIPDRPCLALLCLASPCLGKADATLLTGCIQWLLPSSTLGEA